MYEVFTHFKENFERRFNHQSILNLGEDSLRYDFFVSLMTNKNLSPHQIQVEFPIHRNAYIARENSNSKRNENPQIDLYSELQETSITAEFGLFKRNSNPQGSINKTEKQFKMLNDFLRLALNQYYLPNEAYFICLADDKILNSSIKYNNIENFPAQTYNFNISDLNDWTESSKTAKDTFDNRFVLKASELNILITANKVFESEVMNPSNEELFENNLLTKIIVYKVDFINL